MATVVGFLLLISVQFSLFEAGPTGSPGGPTGGPTGGASSTGSTAGGPTGGPAGSPTGSPAGGGGGGGGGGAKCQLPSWLTNSRTYRQGPGSSCQGLKAGATCTVACAPGNGPNTATLTCSSSGSLTGTAPVCAPAVCNYTTSDASQNVTLCTNVMPGKSCSVTCSNGYQYSQGSSRQRWICNNSGGFVEASGMPPTAPTCIQRTCKPPHSLGIPGFNASACAGYVPGQSCLLQCNNNFVAMSNANGVTAPAVNATNVMCNANLMFSTPAGFSCARPSCGNLSNYVSMASTPGLVLGPRCANRTMGDVCHVWCGRGFVPQTLQIQCSGNPNSGSYGGFTTMSGQFLNMPTCVPRPCSLLGIPLGRGLMMNGCGNISAGQSCTINVLPGYQIQDGTTNRTLTCSNTSTLGGFNGLISSTNVTRLTCSASSISAGNIGRFTTSGGNNTVLFGNSVSPMCTNAIPSAPPAVYTCSTSNGGAGAAFTLASGSFSGCTRRLGQSLTVPSVDRRLQTVSSNGSSCQNALSLAAIAAQYTTSSCSAIAINTGCYIGCADGYTGTSTVLQCQATNPAPGYTVSYTLPTCVANSCTGGLPAAQGVNSTCGSVTTGQTCVAQCGPGYTSVGAATQPFTCGSDGNLVGTNPTCNAIPCPLQLFPAMYSTTCDGSQLTSETCFVGCAAGYSITGSPAPFVCQTNGLVTGTFPTCSALPCSASPPVAVDNSWYTDANCTLPNYLSTGGFCNMYCSPGFSGSPTQYSCDPAGSGAAIGIPPTCTPTSCAGLVQSSNSAQGIVLDDGGTCTGIASGSSCLVGCAAGFSMGGIGAQLWTCGWSSSSSSMVVSGPMPTCTGQACTDGFPDSTVYNSNCSGTIGGQQCQVCNSSCPTGTSSCANWACYGDGLVSGNAPAATCAAPPATTVLSFSSLTVTGLSNSSDFVVNPLVQTASTNFAVTISGVNNVAGITSYSVVPAMTRNSRRLEGLGRRAQAGNGSVTIRYTISVTAPATLTTVGQSIISSVQGMTAAQLQTAFNSALSSAGSSYTVIISSPITVSFPTTLPPSGSGPYGSSTTKGATVSGAHRGQLLALAALLFVRGQA